MVTLALFYPNFKLQYLMNYSSDFNNFCRFKLLAVCTTVVISRPESWGPNFYSPFFQSRQCFHENIINNHTSHKNTIQQCISHSASIITVLVKTYTPCQGVVWSQYSLPGTFYVPLGFGVVLFAKVCFFLPVQFWKAVDFTPALLYPNFKLQ